MSGFLRVMRYSRQSRAGDILQGIKESMMKHIQRAIALSGLILLFTFSSAFAQSEQITVNIPFNFTVGERTLPAGEYVLQRNRRDSNTVWFIRNRSNRSAVVMLTQSVLANDVQQKTKLVFRRYDDLYFLAEFWTAGNQSGRELQVSNRERALDKALAMKKQEYVLTGGK